MTRKLIYSSLLAVALLGGCSEDDTDTGGGDNDTPTERTETTQGGSDGLTTTPASVEQTPVQSNTPQPTVQNQAPMVDAGADKTVTVNESVTITGSATDSDGTISSIEWKKGNEVLATTLSFSYTPTEVGTDVLTLVVVDDDGESSSDSLSITITSTNDLTEQG
jgi:PBP1b-binding outer membrane lipoprotein LpoB